ncbi:DUF397 domain-containing protein [Actinocatenispora rupis]|uniref:DUF397 domain-containing protein n=1 Tax=Actinocatenispora rupis TaxID=519421 RepID=A0A8J3JDV5_9ACTN|nr:DUF397 domain-containing protein [Actinocatenispora rupis]GID14904.1 DUF397 domain-containing protein [Actinocatenispora rupis]
MSNLAEAIWIKSSRSGNQGNCIEYAPNLMATEGVVGVRDSKDPEGPKMTFAPESWTAFVRQVKAGSLNS